MARELVTGCSISPIVSAIDGAQRARHRRTNHTKSPEIKVAPTTPPMTPPSILPRFKLACEVRVDVEDGPDPDAVGEKVNVPVTSMLSGQHKVCVDKVKLSPTSYGFRYCKVPAVIDL